MRLIGAFLVGLGALIIAVPEIQSPSIEPVYGGIIAVLGLLMIASSIRRE